jgi:thiol-disulfide isomerase/thioredoxin
MKKTTLIIATVVVLVAGAYLLDRFLPAASTGNPLGPGRPAPNVVFKTLEGKDVPLSDYKGKVVLVNFWATWCDPCLAEIPWLIEYQNKYASRGFTVLGVALDEEGKPVVEPWVQKHTFEVNHQKVAMNYPIFLGGDPQTEKFGGLQGYPTSVLISRDGRKVKTIVGMILSPDELEKDIEALLKQ